MNYTQLQTAVEDYTENTFGAADFATMTRLAEQKIYNAVSLPTLRKSTNITLTASNPVVNLPTDFLSSFSYAVLSTVQVNYSLIPAAILSAIVGLEPQQTLFITTTIGGRALADIDNNGSVSIADANIYTSWTSNPASVTAAQRTYIETVMNPYMVANPATYAAYLTSSGNYAYLLNKDVNFMQESFPNPATTGTPKYYSLNGAPNTPLVQTFRLGPTPDIPYVTVLNYMAYPASISTAGTSWLGENFESVLFNGVMVEAARFMKQEPDIVAMYEKQFQESLLLLKNLGDAKNRTDAYRGGQPRLPVA